jgi:aspartyl-tRNA(Asn)/glutamyl-tRNA(Gln) amidotransferase subunit A
VSLPCGFTSKGLPIGLQVYAKPFDEAIALRVAHAYEQATAWHARRPDLTAFQGGKPRAQ